MCRMVGKLLRLIGHTVYVFCDIGEDARRYSNEVRQHGHADTLNARSATNDVTVLKIYKENMMKLLAADAVVLVLPSGKSAHLEAGFAVGRGKPVYVIGELRDGDWDAMYCMCNGIFAYEDIISLMDRLKIISQ